MASTRPRYARRVDARHVGGRVSVRHLVDDPERGPVPTDVVGRLISHDDELLLVVDRDAQLHVVACANVLASRPVPAHPRLPAEPDVGTREHPLVRQAARALVLDDEGAVLLVAHRPGEGTEVWTAPGGGMRPGEDGRAAASRELTEEIGITAEPGPLVLERRATFPFRSAWLEQNERWFLARVPGARPGGTWLRDAPLDDPGITRARWWTPGELTTAGRVEPPELAGYVDSILAHGPPRQPWRLGL